MGEFTLQCLMSLLLKYDPLSLCLFANRLTYTPCTNDANGSASEYS